MLVPKWRNLLCLKNSSLIPKISSSSVSRHHASFHSTCVLSEKWNKQCGSNGNVPKSSKSQIRYTVRQKRADAKKALNHLLFHAGGLRGALQDGWNVDSPKQGKPRKKCKPGQGKKPRDKKTMRWHRQGSISDGYDSDNRFQDTFARRVYSQSFRHGSGCRSSASSSSGFEWREGWSWTKQSTKKGWEDNEYGDEFQSVGSRSDREILGLPRFGPLKSEDVKKAFQAAAFKWHPDKNQGAAQATAQEKFKLCLAAYNSICSALHQRLQNH